MSEATYQPGMPWPDPWPDAAPHSHHALIQSVWTSDCRRHVHIARWHREEHPKKPTLELPAGYPPESGAETDELFRFDETRDRRRDHEHEREIRVPYVD